MAATHILAIDQGTTSTRVLVFDDAARIVGSAQVELAQHYPEPGWVEHDAEDIWRDTLSCMRGAIADAGLAATDIRAIGITCQRETSLIWDRTTGQPLCRAIVWQDRRGEPLCQRLRDAGAEAQVTATTGLLLDPYFSASKLAWMLDTIPGARARAEAGDLAFGTIDSFLLWRLTGGRVHVSDVTNASRTMLYDIHAMDWSDAMCALFGVPRALLPRVVDNAGAFGTTDPALLGAAIPVTGMAGDQQAALVGQGCFAPGMAKATYGTGCFLLMNSGPRAHVSRNRLLTTVGYRAAKQMAYALEGSIFVAGSGVRWLRDALGIISDAGQTAALAASLPDNGGVYLVPGFTGLGAPHWRADATGLITGLTLGSGAAHIARAMLESVAYQTHDLITAMQADGADALAALRVDGGMVANDWLCQFLADILAVPVERPAMLESTAHGAAFLAGIGSGLWSGMGEVASLASQVQRFTPAMGEGARTALLAGWQRALTKALI